MIGMKSFLAAATLVVGLSAATAANAGKLEDIQQAGVIKVGIALTGEPIGIREADNNPVCYDVEVRRAWLPSNVAYSLAMPSPPREGCALTGVLGAVQA